MNRLAIAFILGGAMFAGDAIAADGLEFVEHYEVAYVQQCSREHSERACRCSVESLE